jgi:hypothetical protein
MVLRASYAGGEAIEHEGKAGDLRLKIALP